MISNALLGMYLHESVSARGVTPKNGNSRL